MSERAPYSRVYWSILDDPKFLGVRSKPIHLGSWLLLLVVADMAHPAPAFVPPTITKPSLRVLTDCGLIDLLPDGMFRVHGLDAERGKRSESGRNASASRWHSERKANGMLDETRLDKTSNTRASANGTKPSSVDRDPLLRAYRDAILEVNGPGMDEPPAGWKVRPDASR